MDQQATMIFKTIRIICLYSIKYNKYIYNSKAKAIIHFSFYKLDLLILIRILLLLVGQLDYHRGLLVACFLLISLDWLFAVAFEFR